MNRSNGYSPTPRTRSSTSPSDHSLESHCDIAVIEIPSYTLRKSQEGGQEYCTYRVHVYMKSGHKLPIWTQSHHKLPLWSYIYMKSGIRWVVDKRFSDFRSLRTELNFVRPDLKTLSFPKKRWFFNLAESFLSERREQLCDYLRRLMVADPLSTI